jgi:hypothetical protein
MKSTVMIGALLLGSLLAGPAWSHHAAEGIISDDVWQMIDDNLEAVDSPHLNIDFDDVMGSMRVAEDDDGDMYLVSGITVYPEDVDDYLVVIEATLEDAKTMPSGTTSSGTASTAFIETVERDDGFVDILLYEPIGNGNSQVPPVSSTPGKRS